MQELKPNPQAPDHAASYRKLYPILWILFGIVVIAFHLSPIISTLRAKPGKDFAKDFGGVWYPTAQEVLHHGNIYTLQDDGTFVFMYPATAAVLLAIPAMFGKLPMIIILVLINTTAWITSIFLSVYLSRGRAFLQHPLLYVVPSLCTILYIWSTFLIVQPNLLLLAVMLIGFVCLQKKRWSWAGTMFAFATSIKAFPFLVIFYLIYRRMWMATVSMIVALVLLVIVLPLAFGQDSVADLRTWTNGMLLNNKAEGIGMRPQRTFKWKNQSLFAVVNRLMRHVQADQLDDKNSDTDTLQAASQPDTQARTTNPSDEKNHVFVNIMNVSPMSAAVVVVLIAGILSLFFMWSIPAKATRTAATDAYEYAMVILLILMFSPYSFGYFYTWLLFPLTVAWNAVFEVYNQPQRLKLRLTWLLIALLTLVLGLPVGPLRIFRDVGNNFFACVFLLVGLGLLLREVQNKAGNSLSPSNTPLPV